MMSTGTFPEVKRPGRGFDHPNPSGAEVKERVELCLYSLSWPSWSVTGWTLPLPLKTSAPCSTPDLQGTWKILPSTRMHNFKAMCLNRKVQKWLPFSLNKFAYPPSFFIHCRKSEVGENSVMFILWFLQLGQLVQK